MLDKFINRQNELDVLTKRFASNKPEFLIIYGRRRIGKTELIKQFIKSRPHIYFLADKRHETDQLKEIARKVGEFFKDDFVAAKGFSDWIEAFEYIARVKERLIIVIDEFPYLVEGSKAIPSIFQKIWDEILSEKNVFLILCGSSVSMMEKTTLSYRSPLYGRRTGQLLLLPLRFKQAKAFFDGLRIEKQIEYFSILGGIPAYLNQFDYTKDIFENVKDKWLKKDSFLYNDPEFVLKEELREPRVYFSILKAISFGKTRVNDISTYLEMKGNEISRYLSILENLGFIRREIPITERHPHKSRKGIYIINDNFLKFYFRFVFPFRSEIEEGKEDYVVEEIKNNLNSFVGEAFEGIAKELVLEQHPTKFSRAGRWWEKGEEIDLLFLNDKNNEVLFIEVKWQDIKKGKALQILNHLKDKAKKVKWGDERKEHYGLVARKIEDKKELENQGYLVYDLEDISQL